MNTATMMRTPATWESVFPEFNGTVMGRIQEWTGNDPDRLAVLYRAAMEEASDADSKGDAFVYASATKGHAGPAAVITEFLRVYSEGYIETIIDIAERRMKSEAADDGTSAPDRPAAPMLSMGHAQDDAADDDEDDSDEDDGNSLVDVKHILNSAIPKARAVVAALQVVDGLPMLDNPDESDDDKGIEAVADMVSATLIRSIDGVIAEMPLAERARMVKLVMEQAGPHLRDFNVNRDGDKPINTPAVVNLLTRSGDEVESLIDALSSQRMMDEIEMGITEAMGYLFDAMPLDVQARTYKLVHARAMHWRESADKRKS